MQFRGIVFDLDGTLLDTLEDLGNSMNSVLQRCGFPDHPLESYKYFVGDGVESLVRRQTDDSRRHPHEDRGRLHHSHRVLSWRVFPPLSAVSTRL